MSKTKAKIVEQVQSLLALAADGAAKRTNEATNAALRAAALIREHGLVVVEAAEEAAREAVEEATGVRVPTTRTEFEDLIVQNAPKVAGQVVAAVFSDVLLGRKRRRRR